VTIRYRLYLLQALPLLVPLTDLTKDVLSELYSKHVLSLLDRSIALYIYIAADNLLNLFLTISGTSLCNCVTNTRIDRYYKIDDNFVLII
jgi:hypothetical protein